VIQIVRTSTSPQLSQQSSFDLIAVNRPVRGRQFFASGHLTEEQKTKAATIRDEYRPKIHEAGNKLRGLIKDEVKQIIAVIKS
jgi:hypothetical protein